MPEPEWTADELKSETLRNERGEMDADQAHLVDIERELALLPIPVDVMARIGAAFRFAHDTLEEIHRHPMGVSRAKLLEPIRRWRAKRATIAQNLGRRQRQG